MLARSNDVEPESAVKAMNFSQMTISMSSVAFASSAVARAGSKKLHHHRVTFGRIRHYHVQPAGAANYTWSINHGGHVNHAASNLSTGDMRSNHADAVDSILQSQYASLLFNHGAERARRSLGIAQLHRKNDQINWADIGRIFGSIDGRQMERMRRTLDLQSIAPHRLKVRAPRNKGHVLASRLEPTPDVSPNPARTHDRYAHN